MERSPLLETKDLAAGYRKKVIADGICFTVRAGEILTLIGPNGAGKSTVLKTVAAQLESISGEIALCGKPLDSLHEKDIAKQLSILFTARMTAERLTCFDAAAAGRYPYTGMLGLLSEKDRAIVTEALEMTGAAALAEQEFREISDGQRQSVMLARAIAQEPRVLLLDEPTSYLDISRKLELLTLLRRLAKERGIAVVMSLHELDLAQKFSDQVLCISSGRAQRIGTPEEIFRGDYISELYGIRSGRYDPLYGTAEPAPPAGDPQVFVIGGGGTAIPVCRRLFRAGIPFAAGVIHENDLDYPVLAALSTKLITAPPFDPIPEEAFTAARDCMTQCRSVICTVSSFGTLNRQNEALRALAEAAGTLRTAL